MYSDDVNVIGVVVVVVEWVWVGEYHVGGSGGLVMEGEGKKE